MAKRQNKLQHSVRTHAATRGNVLQPAAMWVLAFAGLLVICCESTRLMGADHTIVWLSRVCAPLMHLANAKILELNHVLRKSGHFFGYGTLGLIFTQGWLSLLMTRVHQGRTRMRYIAIALGVFSVALVASMDEIHQSFLPNRTACLSDVLLDTAGAVLLITAASLLHPLRRRRTLMRLLQMRTLRDWQTGSSLFKHALLDLPR